MLKLHLPHSFKSLSSSLHVREQCKVAGLSCTKDAQSVSVSLWPNSRCRFLQGELIHCHDETNKNSFLNLITAVVSSMCPIKYTSLSFSSLLIAIFRQLQYIFIFKDRNFDLRHGWQIIVVQPYINTLLFTDWSYPLSNIFNVFHRHFSILLFYINIHRQQILSRTDDLSELKKLSVH